MLARFADRLGLIEPTAHSTDWSRSSLAAFTNRAAAPFVVCARSIFSLCAALADSSKFLQPLPDVFHLELVEALTAEMRNELQGILTICVTAP